MQKAKNETCRGSTIKYKAIKYIRLSSSDEKAGESDSVANQRRIIDDYLKQHPEIEVVGEKVDDGWSGILFDRPAFTEMMEEFKSGRANCCVPKDLSRFGRDYIETGRYLRNIFPTLGVRFIAINDSIDTLTDSGDDLIISLKTIINDSYCRDISIKTRSALAAKRENREYVGSFPIYGYRKSDHNHNLLVIDEYPAGIIREVFSMKLDGMSAGRIADALNERDVLSPLEYKKAHGLPHPKNGFSDREDAKWSAKTILQILKNETYTGTLIQGVRSTPNYKLQEVFIKPVGEWKRVENTHEAIISKKDFKLMQKILLLDTRTSPNDDKLYIFSGMLVCGCCGSRMTRKSVPYKEIKYHYYGCPTTKKKGCGDSAMLKEDKLMQFVLKALRSHASNVISLEYAITRLDADRIARQLEKRLDAQVNENRGRLENIRRYEASLDESLLNGTLTKSEYELIKENCTEDADKLIANNEHLQRQIIGAPLYKQEQLAWLEHFKEFSDINALDRRTVISLIQSIKIKSKTEIEIVFHYQSEYDTAQALIGAIN